jgi:hypothetical protein
MWYLRYFCRKPVRISWCVLQHTDMKTENTAVCPAVTEGLHWTRRSCRWGEITCQNWGHQRANCSTPQVIYEHGEPWWNDIDGTKAGGTAETNKFCLTKNLFHTSKGSLTCRKILRHGADSFTYPPKERVLRIFIALKNPSPSAGFEPANLGSNGKQS